MALPSHFKLSILFCLLISPLVAKAQINISTGEGKDQVKFTPTTSIFLDGAAYIDDKTDLGNGLGLPELRLGFKADYQRWTTRVDIGFAYNEVSVKDVFAQYSINQTSHLKVGHYPEPFGLDRMESSSRIKFMTPSASSEAFSPNRKIGVMYTGWSKYFWYAGGLFGDGDAVRNGNEGDDGYAATGRFVFNSLNNSGKVFHLGFSGAVRKADANGRDDDGQKVYKSLKYSSSLLTNIESLNPLEAVVDEVNYQAKYAVELIGVFDRFFLQSEYFHTNVRRHHDAPTYQAEGVYAQIGYMLIGGDYTYSTSVARLGNNKPKSLEVVGRFNYTDLNDARSGIYGGNMRDWSLAFNYYLNRYMMFRLNYSYINTGRQNPALANEDIQAIQARVQVVF